MRSKHALLWSSALALLLAPVLACILAWSMASRPGPARDVAAPLMPNYRLELDIRPCDTAHPGRVTIWYIDSSRANRFVRDRFALLLRTVVAPPCA
jgi:hypothetical protein